jgi:hypothetical protein
MRNGRTTFGTAQDAAAAEAMRAAADRAGWLLSADQLRKRLDELLDRNLRDWDIVQQAGRWALGRPDPEEFVPGDVLALRWLTVGSAMNQARGLAERAMPTAAGDPHRSARTSGSLALAARTTASAVWRVATATPYFLEVRNAVGILASRPAPTELLEELHLPFPAVTVYFGADLALDPRLLAWSEGLDAPDRQRQSQAATMLSEVPFLVSRMDLENDVRRLGGYLTGVTLLAGPGGQGVEDQVFWHVATNPVPSPLEPMGFDRGRGMLWGRRSYATLGQLADNLAAAVAWGDWKPPEPPPPLTAAPGSRPWRKALKTGPFRRALQRGAFADVHVLDTTTQQPAPAAQRPADGGAQRTSPIAHTRRGHWRRVRVGPTTGWRYEGRWIAPTVVNPGGPTRPGRTVVYRLPVPDTARSPLGVDPEDPTGQLPEP